MLYVHSYCFYTNIHRILIIKNIGKDGAVVPGQVELSRPSDPSKVLPFPLGCWVLPVNAVWACVGKGSEGGFSPGYVLLSFQTLTPSCGQLEANYSVWNKAASTPDSPEEILSIKEVGWR